MKEFKKDKDGKFICEECGKAFKLHMGLSQHIRLMHDVLKYYNKWLFENGDDKCVMCGKPVTFLGIRGYKKICSKKCRFDHVKQLHIENFGVENPFQRKSVKEKCKQTWVEHYGVDNPNRDPGVRNKIINTCLEKYDCEYALQNKNVREKQKNTIIERFGVEHQSQNEEVHYRQMNNGKKIKYYKNTKLWYQGTFELDFIDKYILIFPELERGPSIPYIFNNKNKIYHSDFYIKILNLVIEVKDSYRARVDKDKITAKEKATIANGYNFVMIIDKDYSMLESFLTNHGTSNL